MATFRDNWSNKILHLSSFIHTKKNDLVLANSWKAFGVVLSIIVAEILLLILSLPSYLVMRDRDTTGDHSDVRQYKLRRALTLGTIATLLIIWAIKLILILFLVWHTNTYGTIKINETNNQNAVINSTAHDMLVAGVDDKLSPPHIAVVESKHGEIALTGTAQSGEAVIILFSETGTRANFPPKIYTAWTDTKGAFSLTEDSSVFNLPPGNYSVSGITYDPAHKTKSSNSTTFSFTVHQTLTERFVHSFDVLLNILALMAIIIGLLVTILVS